MLVLLMVSNQALMLLWHTVFRVLLEMGSLFFRRLLVKKIYNFHVNSQNAWSYDVYDLSVSDAPVYDFATPADYAAHTKSTSVSEVSLVETPKTVHFDGVNVERNLILVSATLFTSMATVTSILLTVRLMFRLRFLLDLQALVLLLRVKVTKLLYCIRMKILVSSLLVAGSTK